jgi:transcriptional regulator with XRE-family HTH domain
MNSFKRARLDAGMTMDEVVKTGVISKGYLSEIENDKRNNLSYVIVIKLSVIYGISHFILTESINFE